RSRVAPAALRGVKDTLPVIAGLAPFSLVLGITIAGSGVPEISGWLGGVLLFSGSAHLAAITMLSSGAAAWAVVATALIINSRFMMYSASLGPRFREQPRWFRWIGPQMLIDQTYTLVSTNVRREESPATFRTYYLASGVTLALGWFSIMAIGIRLGPGVSVAGVLEFAIPMMFLAMLVPTLKSRPAIAAAATGALVSVAAGSLPNGMGLLIGAVAGLVVGYRTERRDR
ncbi:MAG: AzlC family ABC transporter permease, partial [Actinomycetota bacterium]|nr:AzlC family ABC transporter permease [Actinomycetota bacterium]